MGKIIYNNLNNNRAFMGEWDISYAEIGIVMDLLAAC